MRKLLTILTFILSTAAFAQTTVPLGSSNPLDNNRIKGRLQVDNLVKLLNYATGHTMLLAVDGSGNVVLRDTSTGGGGGTTYHPGFAIIFRNDSLFVDTSRVVSNYHLLKTVSDTATGIKGYINGLFTQYYTSDQVDALLDNYYDKTASDARYLQSYTETDPLVPSWVKAIVNLDIANWNTAFSWGNHASAGYALNSKVVADSLKDADSIRVHRIAIDNFNATVQHLPTYSDTLYTAGTALSSGGNSYDTDFGDTAYSSILADSLGVSVDHLGLSGRDAIGLNEQFDHYGQPYNRTKANILLVNTNDSRRCPDFYQISNMHTESIRRWIAVQNSDTIIGFASTSITKTAGAGVVSYPIGLGSRTTIPSSTRGGILFGSLNDSAIFTPPAAWTNITLGYYNSYEYGNIQVKICRATDTIIDTIFTTKACLSSQIYPSTYVYSAIKIYEYAAGTNPTIIIKPLGGGSSVWPLDFIGHMKNPQDCKPIYIADCPLLPSTSYKNKLYAAAGYGCGSRERIIQLNTETRALVYNEFCQYPIGFVNTNEYINPNTDFNSDALHLNKQGANNVARGFLDAIYRKKDKDRYFGTIPYLGDSLQVTTTVQTAATIFPKGNIAMTPSGLMTYNKATDEYIRMCMMDTTIRILDSIHYPAKRGTITESPAGKFSATGSGSNTVYMSSYQPFPSNQSGYIQWQFGTGTVATLMCVETDTVNHNWGANTRYWVYVNAGTYFVGGLLWCPGACGINTGVAWSPTDIIRLGRINGVWDVKKSSNSGANWDVVYAGNNFVDTIAVYNHVSWTGTAFGSIINPVLGYGYTLTGKPSMEVAYMYYKPNTSPQPPLTGFAFSATDSVPTVTKPSGATYTLTDPAIRILYSDTLNRRVTTKKYVDSLIATLSGGGIASLNGLTGSIQTLGWDSSGSNISISSTGTAHIFSFPTASSTKRGVLSAADWIAFNAKQTALGFTPENIANKATDFTTINGTLYPSVAACSTFVATSIAALSSVYAAASHTHTFASLTSKPTTIVGYGIVDAQPLNTDLTAIAAITPTNDDIVQRKAGVWVSRSLAQYKADLALNNVENTALSTYVGNTNFTTLGTISTGTWNATTIATTKGGTGLTSYTLGDIPYSSATNTLSNLAGNTTSTKKFLNQTGTGSVSAAPAWAALVAGDIPDLSGTYALKGAITSGGITMSTARLIGRTTASTGAPEEITVSSPLTLASGALGVSNATGSVSGVVTTAAQTFAGAKTFNNQYAGALFTITYSSTVAVDFTNGNCQFISATGNWAPSAFSNPIAGGRYVIMVNNNGGSRTITWPASVKWPAGTTPTPSASGKVDIYSLFYDGTNYYGGANSNY